MWKSSQQEFSNFYIAMTRLLNQLSGADIEDHDQILQEMTKTAEDADKAELFDIMPKEERELRSILLRQLFNERDRILENTRKLQEGTKGLFEEQQQSFQEQIDNLKSEHVQQQKGLQNKVSELEKQLSTQETMYQIQLQQMGQYIQQLTTRAQTQIQQLTEGYTKLLREKEERESFGTEQHETPMSSVDTPVPPNFDAFDKFTKMTRTKSGNVKATTTWSYPGRDQKNHVVTLKYNTRLGKDNKSKRMVIVDGKVRYEAKSEVKKFTIKNGIDQITIMIGIDERFITGNPYELYINGLSFRDAILHNKYLKSIS